MTPTLGVCYYPEHWPEAQWAEDAARMAELGLTWVRIGEFAWRRIEPRAGVFDWAWLDRAIETLGRAGLKVVLGTPTATPPRWLLDSYPDMIALDADGRPRGFGSRRHYCFSHAGYLEECRRIVRELADRYGQNPYVAAWQTDNEYGCHDTVLSYSDAAQTAFQHWLRARYGDIGRLNDAWGNVFWSMEYDRFEQVALPNLTVTEPNPAHVQAFRRFSSDQVVAFNRAQVEILREGSDKPIAHNYMGRTTDFDHFAAGADLEIASWDSYPLGFLEDRVGASDDELRAFARQGHPDFQAFHHDLYRAVGKGRWWVMEQQPGPVNWAPHNPAPLPGMVRLWTWEAIAHGAEAVCYFRWRQAPFAQEQLHTGLLRPDSVAAAGYREAAQVIDEIADQGAIEQVRAPVALIFDYDAQWAWETQPHGQGLDYFDLIFNTYRSLREMGVSVDLLPPDTSDFDGYALVLAPGLMHLTDALKERLSQVTGVAVLGPRTGARDADFRIPLPLPPHLPGAACAVAAVESLRPDTPIPLAGGGAVTRYFEHLDHAANARLETVDGQAFAVDLAPNLIYVAGWGDGIAMRRLFAPILQDAGIETQDLPDGLRRRETAGHVFWFNYSAHEIGFGGRVHPPASVSIDRL